MVGRAVLLLPAASAPLQQYERLASVRALVEAGPWRYDSNDPALTAAGPVVP